jgi:hypothetical protein
VNALAVRLQVSQIGSMATDSLAEPPPSRAVSESRSDVLGKFIHNAMDRPLAGRYVETCEMPSLSYFICKPVSFEKDF